MDPALQGALEAVALGLRVFPIWAPDGAGCTCHKADCSSPGKHPIESGWQTSATSHESKVRALARKYGNPNWGAVCGRLVVVDVDLDRGGELDALPDLPPTGYFVETGSGGVHFGYWNNNGTPVPSTKPPQRGIDLQAEGKLVVLPGSMHASGRRYRWVKGPPEPDDVGIWPEQWPWPDTPASGNGDARSTFTDLLADMPQRDHEGRNEHFAQLAGHLAKWVPHEDAFFAIAHTLDETRAQPLGGEADKVLRSIWDKERGKEPAVVEDEWEFRSLTDPPAEPERFGPGELFYRGKVHMLLGEPDSGKSILAYAAAIEEMQAGNNVLLLDEDAGLQDVASKLYALGATPEMLEQHMGYLEPEGRNLVRMRQRLFQLMDEWKPTLVILDAMLDHLVAAGLDENDATDVGTFMGAILPLTRTYGAAVVIVDHVSKADAEGRFGRGSTVKGAKGDVAYNIAMTDHFSRQQSGRLGIRCTKDKPGFIGRGTAWAVYVNVDEDAIGLDFNEPMTRSDRKLLPQDEGARGKIRTALEEADRAMTTREIALATGIKRNTASEHLNRMERDGIVRRTGDPRKPSWEPT